MDGLSRRDLASALDFLDGAYRRSDVDHLARYVTKRLLRLVPSDCSAYNEINPRRRRIRWVYDGVPPISDGERVFAMHMAEHPFIPHFRLPGAGAAVKISDFLSAREWRGRGMYCEFYRPMGGEHVIAITIPAAPPLMLGIAAVRGGRDFNERDRHMLDTIRPHLVRAYESAVAGAEHAADLALLGQGIEALDAAAIVLGADGRIRFATIRARQLLAAYFGDRAAVAARPPEPLAAWLAAGELPAAASEARPAIHRPFVASRDGARLVVQVLTRGAGRVLLLQEERTMPRPEDFAPLGLTRRETEMLMWLTLGKTDAEIGTILGVSPRTVSHTLERVYRKLGVAGRAAAAAVALRATHLRVPLE